MLYKSQSFPIEEETNRPRLCILAISFDQIESPDVNLILSSVNVKAFYCFCVDRLRNGWDLG